MHFDSHVDGYMFTKPQGMPYFYHDRLDEVSVKCDPEICDRHKHAKYDHVCDCFIHYYFKLNSTVQVSFVKVFTLISLGPGHRLYDILFVGPGRIKHAPQF